MRAVSGDRSRAERLTEMCEDGLGYLMFGAAGAALVVGAVGLYKMHNAPLPTPQQAVATAGFLDNLQREAATPVQLDNRQTFAFASVLACTKATHSKDFCLRTKLTALANQSRPFVYDSLAKHDAVHGKGNHDVIPGTSSNTFIPSGGGSFIAISSEKPDQYTPRVAGWQVTPEVPQGALPLYATPNPKVGMRFDGKLLALDVP